MVRRGPFSLAVSVDSRYPDGSFHLLVPSGLPKQSAGLNLQRVLCPAAYKAELEFWREKEGRSISNIILRTFGVLLNTSLLKRQQKLFLK